MVTVGQSGTILLKGTNFPTKSMNGHSVLLLQTFFFLKLCLAKSPQDLFRATACSADGRPLWEDIKHITRTKWWVRLQLLGTRGASLGP